MSSRIRARTYTPSATAMCSIASRAPIAIPMSRQGNAIFARIDPNNRTSHLLPEYTHRRNRRPSADLHHDRALKAGLPCMQARLLPHSATIDPTTVIEHKDVRPCHTSAMRANRRPGHHSARNCIDDRHCINGWPHGIAARRQALHHVDAAMAFRDSPRFKTSSLELAIDITGKHEAAVRHA